MVSAEASPSRARNHDILTLSAIGYIAYYLIVQWHEVVGHGLPFYLMGSRHLLLTSTSMDAPDNIPAVAVGTMGSRFVSVSGSLSTILLALVLYPWLRHAIRTRANISLRFFLWLMVAIGFFHGCCYPTYSGIFGAGDWADIIALWPHQGLLRAIEIVLGIVLCTVTVRAFAPLFGTFSESLVRLAMVPYLAGTVGTGIGGFFLPAEQMYYIIIGLIPSALIGQGVLLFIVPRARKVRTEVPVGEVIPRSPTAIVLAIIVLAIMILTARGVHFYFA
ncbi:hypothetical protein LZC95_49700 [Pendulispora brunnea]|uniref:Uncharacterized protein n=1 Tax=Pendulispora brunnea TaxID=2905690 RepID=A0ABZ2KAX3_9BACT